MKHQAIMNLLIEEPEPQSLWSTIKNMFSSPIHYIEMVIDTPKYELFRLQTLVEDLNELTGHEFELENLIDFIFKDILNQARRGKIKYATFAKKIFELYEVHKAPLIESSLRKVAENQWTRMEQEVPKEKRYIPLSYTCHRKEVVRGEVLVMDIQKHSKENMHITLPDLLSLLLINFVSEMEKGNFDKLLDTLIESVMEET